MAPVRLLGFGLLLVLVAVLVSAGAVHVRFNHMVAVIFAGTVFVFAFISTEAGLCLVLLSMLLSPEFALGGGGLGETRSVVLRFEDILLIVIAFSWIAKTAVNKELGLVVKTPLNRPILAYILMTFAATLVGYFTGTVKTAAGFFYVLKYVEYFVVFYLTVNHLHDRTQAWRLIMVAFATAAIVSVIGVSQIPGGERVSAPFEGAEGEPNTLGGYLLLMMAVVAGLALETTRIATRVKSLALLALMTVPFTFTLSRASYLGVVPTVAVLTWLSARRKAMVPVFAFLVVASPLLYSVLLPRPVVNRVLYTFQPEEGNATARVGRVEFDPSTSERLFAMRRAIEGWTQRPILGYGVTGYRFLDSQFARTLVETGALGMVAFVWLVWAVLRSGFGAFRATTDPDERGIALGFVAGTVGLLAHAVGSNTFIIVRIMEPFWFFAAVVIMLPKLADAPIPRRAPLPARLLRYS